MPWGILLSIVGLAAIAIRVSLGVRIEQSVLGGSLVADSQSYWDWATHLLHRTGGIEPYFLAPLYPYLLAGIRAVVGDARLPIVCVQALFGACAAVLVADMARRVSSPTIGSCSGLLVAACAPLVLHDNLVLAESPLFLLGTAFLWVATLEPRTFGRHVQYVLMGGLVGLLSIGRGTQVALLLAVPFVPGTRATRSIGTAVAVLTALLTIAPVTIHNYRACHELILTTYSAGYNVAVGYGPNANGGFAPPTGTSVLMRAPGSGSTGGVEWDGRDEIKRMTGRQLSPLASSAYWGHVALEAIREDPLRALRLAGLKVLMLFNRREYPQIENLHTYESVLGPVGLPTEFVVPPLLGLALVGLWRRGREDRIRLLVACLLIQTVVLVPFFVTDRYRLHLIPSLIGLGAAGAQVLLTEWRAREHHRLLRRTLPALAVGLALAWMPIPGLGPAREAWGISMGIGERAFRKGSYALAIKYLEDAAAIEARSGRSWSQKEAMKVPLTAHAFTLGRALLQSGQPDQAREWLLRAKLLSPSLPGIDQWISRSVEVPSGLSTIRERAIAAAQAGRFAEAESLFTRMTRAPDPTFYSWGALVRIQCQTGRIEEARRTLEAGIQSGWSGPARLLHEALVLTLEHRVEEARALVARVDQTQVLADPTLSDVMRILRDLMREKGPS